MQQWCQLKTGQSKVFPFQGFLSKLEKTVNRKGLKSPFPEAIWGLPSFGINFSHNREFLALTSVAQLVGHPFPKEKVSGWMLGQGTCLGGLLSLVRAHLGTSERQPMDVSHIDVSLFLPPYPSL